MLIGLDAADWLTIDPMIEAGRLPTFGRLKADGRTALMVSTPPLVSPILWTTIATGLPPDKHGVLDFMVDLPGGGQTPIRSTDRHGPALWNLFTAAGRTVAVIGWWATWPAEHVRGTIVTDAVAPQLLRGPSQLDAEMVWPEASLRRTASHMVTLSQLTYKDLVEFVPITEQEFAEATRAADSSSSLYEHPLSHLAAIVASTRTYTAAAIEALNTESPDFLAVYFEAIDSVSHLFVRDPVRGPRAIARAYHEADELLRRLAEASPPDTVMIVCSDHGFYPRTAAIPEDPANLTGAATAWHRPYGIAGVATAGVLADRSRPAGPSRPTATMSPLDVAPTVLHAAGLPVTSEMPGRVITALLRDDVAARPVQRIPPPSANAPASASEGRPGDTERARLQSLGYIASTAPGTSLARQNLGEVLYRRDDYRGAEGVLRGLLEVQPSNLTATLWLAKALAAQSRPAEAMAVYERAMSLPGGAREALVEAASVAIQAGRPDLAQTLITTAAHAPDAQSAVAVARGDVAESAGDHRAAVRDYREALRIDPLSFDAAARFFELQARLNRPGDALPLLESAVRTAPDSPRHLALLGEARLRTGDAAGAEPVLSRALQLAPDGNLVRLTLARAQLMRHKPVDAVHTLNAAPLSPERQALLGAAFSAQKHWEDAARALEDATRLGMATPPVLNQLGWAHIQLGRRDRAKVALTQSLGQKPDQPDIRKLLMTLDASPGMPR